jgi:hypothetical protein
MHIVPPFPRRWVGSVRTLRSCAAELRSVCLPGDLTRNPFLLFNKYAGPLFCDRSSAEEIVRLPPPPLESRKQRRSALAPGFLRRRWQICSGAGLRSEGRHPPCGPPVCSVMLQLLAHSGSSVSFCRPAKSAERVSMASPSEKKCSESHTW